MLYNEIWNEIRQHIPFFKYPYHYTFHINEYSCKFIISDPIDEYRIVKFGGEESLLSRVLNSLEEDDIFFDIGSNIGLYSISAAKKVARVIAFEPDSEIRARLLENICINTADNIDIIDWAVSDDKETRFLYSNGAGGYSPSLFEIKGRFKGHKTILCNSIDNAIAENTLPVPTAIKIDIEGAENLALFGMNKLLVSRESPRIIFIEIHPLFLREFNSSSIETIQFLESCGYQCEYQVHRDDEVHCMFIKEPR